MSGTSSVAFKGALIDALDGLPGLEGVSVLYGWEEKEAGRECIYGGDIDFDHEPLTMAGGGRYSREENGAVQLYGTVRIPGGTFRQAEERVVEIGKVVEEFLATNPDLGVDGLKLGHVERGRVASDPDDDGVTAVVNYQVGFMSVLT